MAAGRFEHQALLLTAGRFEMSWACWIEAGMVGMNGQSRMHQQYELLTTQGSVTQVHKTSPTKCHTVNDESNNTEKKKH